MTPGHTETLLTTPGSIIGTFNYMSPEQALGREVDYRTDLFSLGVLYYELLTGVLPFTGDTPIATADAIIHSDPPPINRYNSLAGPELERVVLRMLEKDRARRHQDMRAVYFDLDAIKRGSIQLLSASTFENLSDDSLRKYATPVANTDSGADSSRETRSVAVMSFTNITKNPEDDWLGTGIAETVTSDLQNIEGITVIGRERIGEVLSRLKTTSQSDLAELADQADLNDELVARVGVEVGAHWMICGGYQRFGEMVRITSRIVDIVTGAVLNTVKIDGKMEEIFELQDKIVYEFIRNAHLSLPQGERQMIEQKETRIVAAYEAYSKGLINLFVNTHPALDESIRYFEQAIAFDPNYARAFVHLGYALSLKAQYSNKPELLESALANLQKANLLRPLKAGEYSAFGLALLTIGRDDEAIESIKRGLDLDPNLASLHT
ncbi:MAG: hypothetical protein L0220_16690, partial [Acidobacteria bacterium]|nr:hypothetical protein [Acidobacteriota bacterium]